MLYAIGYFLAIYAFAAIYSAIETYFVYWRNRRK